LNEKQVHEKEPNLNEKIHAAIWCPTTSVLNPYEMTIAAARSCAASGVHIYTSTPVTAIQKTDDGFIVKSNDREFKAKIVVNAAGVFASDVSAMLYKPDFKITARKGEEYLLDRAKKGIVKSVIFPCPNAVTKGTLVIPTVDGTVMVGPTAEALDNYTDKSTTTEGCAKVFSMAKELVPSINMFDVISAFAGLRPAIVENGNDFIIRESSVEGFVECVGIQSPGLTASPAIGEYTVDIIKKICEKKGMKFEDCLVDARIYGLDSRREEYKTVAIKDYDKLTADIQNEIIIKDCKYYREKLKKLIKPILIFVGFGLSYLLYYLSLESCNDGEGACSTYISWIKLKVIEEIISCILLTIMIQTIIFKIIPYIS